MSVIEFNFRRRRCERNMEISIRKGFIMVYSQSFGITLLLGESASIVNDYARWDIYLFNILTAI
ncbi:hypothetical protein GCM10027286_32200 [Virgibacillus ainsalahensis]